jgi:hypothetical protein
MKLLDKKIMKQNIEEDPFSTKKRLKKEVSKKENKKH